MHGGTCSNGAVASSSATTSSSHPTADNLLSLLARTLRHLLAPMPATLRGEEATIEAATAQCDDKAGFALAHAAAAEAEAQERRAMEREVSAAYIALLIGFICKDDEVAAAAALAELADSSFARVGALLRSFLELHASANLISRESANTMAEIVEWMEGR